MKIIEYQNKKGINTIRGEDGKYIYERIEVGIDGDCGYALFGPDIQEGEVVFAKVDKKILDSSAERKAWGEALLKLREALGYHLPYFVRGN